MPFSRSGLYQARCSEKAVGKSLVRLGQRPPTRVLGIGSHTCWQFCTSAKLPTYFEFCSSDKSLDGGASCSGRERPRAGLGLVGKEKAESSRLTWTVWIQILLFPDADYLLC
jgi:hypothetical protein